MTDKIRMNNLENLKRMNAYLPNSLNAGSSNECEELRKFVEEVTNGKKGEEFPIPDKLKELIHEIIQDPGNPFFVLIVKNGLSAMLNMASYTRPPKKGRDWSTESVTDSIPSENGKPPGKSPGKSPGKAPGKTRGNISTEKRDVQIAKLNLQIAELNFQIASLRYQIEALDEANVNAKIELGDT